MTVPVEVAGRERRASSAPSTRDRTWWAWTGYFALGVYFGFVLSKTEVVSWFRIQEMFRLASFYLFGVLGSAVLTAMLSLALLRRAGRGRSLTGTEISMSAKESTPAYVRYWLGGTLFGVGWALLGACPGPLYTLVGSGVTAYAVAIVAALAGTLAYGAVKGRLPH